MNTEGLHHVTAIASDPTRNAAFYTDVLGLRLVKRTVNFDDVTAYHLYYGDVRGQPGTVITFFPWPGSPPGRTGAGQVQATAFAVPSDSLDYWYRRLTEAEVDVDYRGDNDHRNGDGDRNAGDEWLSDRFGDSVLSFADPDGQRLELAAVDGVRTEEPWADGPIPAEYAVCGFFGVTLHSTAPEETVEMLETLGYESVGEDGDYRRFATGGDRATVVDLLTRAVERGRMGPGVVHHVAFRTKDDDEQAMWRDLLVGDGEYVTPVRDRRYFRSIYFREPGGVLFELATDGPGFDIDEPMETLGETLTLPPWLESKQKAIESGLPEVPSRPRWSELRRKVV